MLRQRGPSAFIGTSGGRGRKFGPLDRYRTWLEIQRIWLEENIEPGWRKRRSRLETNLAPGWKTYRTRLEETSHPVGNYQAVKHVPSTTYA
jgi:hypothetical protein